MQNFILVITFITVNVIKLLIDHNKNLTQCTNIIVKYYSSYFSFILYAQAYNEKLKTCDTKQTSK